MINALQSGFGSLIIAAGIMLSVLKGVGLG
jgi:hypothetical protein